MYKQGMEFLAIILAAGKGTRLKSKVAKPLHEVAGRPLINWVSAAANSAGASAQICVIPPDSQQLEKCLPGTIKTVIQDPPKGTGDAVRLCLPQIEKLSKDMPVLILYADTPLIKADTLRALVRKIETDTDICLLGFNTDNPTGYGRIVLSEDKLVKSIIEHKDASEEEQEIRLVNGGVIAAKAGLLLQFLPQLNAANSQSELYLTDLVSMASNTNAKIDVLITEEDELAGVNNKAQLAHVESIMQHKLRARAMVKGVSLQAPETIFLSADTIFGADILIQPHVVIGKGVSIDDNCVIKAFSYLEGSSVGKNCVVGPYARLRPGTKLGKNVKIGNFVETKNTSFKDGSKANHLSYLGDSEIGQMVNIGAGTITCNYDGVNKFKTTIHDGAFIGSNSALVAPIAIGKGALIAAGSVITKDVDENAIGIARSPQKQIKDGASRKKGGKKRSQP